MTDLEAMPQIVECRGAAELSGRPLGAAVTLVVVDDERWVAVFFTETVGVGYWLVTVRPDEHTRFWLDFDQETSTRHFQEAVRALSRSGPGMV
jgi:hypothetical protein